MAKQAGLFKITGCIDNLCFYEMGGDYYVRSKSSLDRKRVKTDPAFKRTRYYADVMGRASSMASSIRRCIPGWESNKQLYRLVLVECMQLIRLGWSEEAIRQRILRNYIPDEENITAKKQKGNQEIKNKVNVQQVFAELLLQELFTRMPVNSNALLLTGEESLPP